MSSRFAGLRKNTQKVTIPLPTAPPAGTTDPARWPLVLFFRDCYAKENPRVAVGSRRTYIDYLVQIRRVQAYFDSCTTLRGESPRDLMLADLTDQLVSGAMAWTIQRGSTIPTANHLRRAMVALSRFAVWDKGLPVKPIRTKSLREAKRLPTAWSIDEFNALLSAAARLKGHVGVVPAHLWWPALLLTLYNTGARISAMMHTPSAGLDLKAATLMIPAEVQKHFADQRFDLLPITVDALRALHPERNFLIFGDDWPHDKSQNHWRALTNKLKRILVSAGLARSVAEVPTSDLFHKLRRTFATRVACGLGQHAAQSALGHSSIEVTRRYLDGRMPIGGRVIDALPAPTIELSPMERRRRDWERAAFGDVAALQVRADGVVTRDCQADDVPSLDPGFTIDAGLGMAASRRPDAAPDERKYHRIRQQGGQP